MNDLETDIVEKILSNLAGRKGCDILGGLDSELQEEIKEDLKDVVGNVLIDHDIDF